LNTVIRSLFDLYPLSSRWSLPEIHEEIIEVGNLKIFSVGIVTEHESGRQIVGSAAQVHAFPWARAYFELLERTSIIEAELSAICAFDLVTESGIPFRSLAKDELCLPDPSPAEWRYSKSNGVAAHTDWNHACSSARWELIERDRILRSWRGEILPRKIALSEKHIPQALEEYYEFFAYKFSDTLLNDSVVGVFALSRSKCLGPIYGFGARDELSSALDVASSECLQRLSFLWGELPSETVEFSPTAEYHQEYYLQPQSAEAIHEWLCGEHVKFCSSLQRSQGLHPILFAEMTPGHLKGKLYVAKAVCPDMLPLIFGRYTGLYPPNFPQEWSVHPIA